MDEAQAKRVAADPDLIAKSLLYFDNELSGTRAENEKLREKVDMLEEENRELRRILEKLGIREPKKSSEKKVKCKIIPLRLAK